MRTVYKYEVPISDSDHEVKLPRGAKILHVDSQHLATVCFWAEVLTEQRQSPARTFRVFGTGHPIPAAIGGSAPYQHVGSVFSRYATLVWHLYEKKND